MTMINMRETFRIGSKITIRSDLNRRMNIMFGINKEMEKLAGMESTIVDIREGHYKLKIDNMQFNWNISMFAEFQLILEKHEKWLNGDPNGERLNLCNIDLSYADLNNAYSITSNLSDFIPIACPEKGSFIGFKKAKSENGNYVIVELLILEDSKRSSATSRKCRCSKAKVLSITSIDERTRYDKAYSIYNRYFVYEVGKVVEVNDFDEDRFQECSKGVHFFITRQEAVNY